MLFNLVGHTVRNSPTDGVNEVVRAPALRRDGAMGYIVEAFPDAPSATPRPKRVVLMPRCIKTP